MRQGHRLGITETRLPSECQRPSCRKIPASSVTHLAGETFHPTMPLLRCSPCARQLAGQWTRTEVLTKHPILCLMAPGLEAPSSELNSSFFIA